MSAALGLLAISAAAPMPQGAYIRHHLLYLEPPADPLRSPAGSAAITVESAEIAEAVEVWMTSSEGVAAVGSSPVFAFVKKCVKAFFPGGKDEFFSDVDDGINFTIKTVWNNAVVTPFYNEMCSKLGFLCSEYQKAMHEQKPEIQEDDSSPVHVSGPWEEDEHHRVEYWIQEGKPPPGVNPNILGEEPHVDKYHSIHYPDGTVVVGA